MDQALRSEQAPAPRSGSRITRNGGIDSGERLAQGLGWFSIALGIAEVAMPRRLARLIGVRGEGRVPALLRVLGLREIASGIGVLSSRQSAGWMWGRVAGDAIDLSLLGGALTSPSTRRDRLAAASAAVAGITALDVLSGTQRTRAPSRAATAEVHAVRTLTVNKSPDEVYRFWRDLENLPRFMQNLESIRVTGDGRRSHWVAKGPADAPIEWDADLVEERTNELIAWRSVPGSTVQHSGTIRFVPAPGGRGTEVKVDIRYTLPAGEVGATVARLLWSAPEQEIDEDLRRFKQVMETGEVVRSDASIHRRPHVAQPTERKHS